MTLVQELAPRIRGGEFDVTVISRDNFHTFHGFACEMLSGRIQPEQLISPARRIFPPARFFNAEVDDIDFAQREVVVNRRIDGREYRFEYDHLVIALGSGDALARYTALGDSGFGLKSFWDCFKVRNRIMRMLELAELEEDREERRRLLTFTVVGGNFGGVEIAGELNDFLGRVAGREYPSVKRDECRVVLLEAGGDILPELGSRYPKMVDYARRTLLRRGVDIRVATRLAAATRDEAILDNGDRIPTKTIISCAGTVPTEFVAGLPLVHHASGRLETDPFLRARGQKNVWAGGDCAAVPHPDGGLCPKTASFALKAGTQIARNIQRVTAGQIPRPFQFRSLGDTCALGGRRALTHVRGIPLYGRAGWLAWRATLWAFVPTWDRKVRLLFDWTATSLVGRSIVDVREPEAVSLRKEHFHTGQTIMREGDAGNELYLIQEGFVDVSTASEGEAKVLTRLGPGRHFGDLAVFGESDRTLTITARTPVKLWAFGSSVAKTLRDVISPLRNEATHTGLTSRPPPPNAKVTIIPGVETELRYPQ